MNDKAIISVLNLKNGVGCSTLVWNIAYTLNLDIYQHDKAIHDYFLKQRIKSVEENKLFKNEIGVYNIDRKNINQGIYDLGSDINYSYVKQIIKKSNVVVIPIELGFEVILKSIATIKYVQEIETDAKIFIVLNKLDSHDSRREMKYSYETEVFILEHIKQINIEFLYIRHSFAIYRNLSQGFCFLDNYIHQDKKFNHLISNFNLLRNLRYYTIDKMLKGQKTKKVKKALKEKENTVFFDKHRAFYEAYFTNKDEKIASIYNLKFNDNNRRLIKDMLILTTKLKAEYSKVWED